MTDDDEIDMMIYVFADSTLTKEYFNQLIIPWSRILTQSIYQWMLFNTTSIAWEVEFHPCNLFYKKKTSKDVFSIDMRLLTVSWWHGAAPPDLWWKVIKFDLIF